MGSLNVNGTLRDHVPVGCSYTGVDVSAGRNVDVVLDDPYRLPFVEGAYDLVVSTSCFEHAEFFWLLFVEMTRVTKPGGFIYVSAPTGGAVHRHPVDCWRFYPDAGAALSRWAGRCGYPAALVSSFVLPPGSEGWSDFVAVWQRASAVTALPALFDRFPNAVHRQP